MEYRRSINTTAQRPPSCKETVQERIAPDEGPLGDADRTPIETNFKLSLGIVFPLLGGRSTWSHEHLLPIFVSLIVALMLMAVPFP